MLGEYVYKTKSTHKFVHVDDPDIPRISTDRYELVSLSTKEAGEDYRTINLVPASTFLDPD